MSLEIRAPLHTKVKAADVDGSIYIHDLQGDVDLELIGKYGAGITSARHLKLETIGSCSVEVKKVTNGAKMELIGKSKVTIGEIAGKVKAELLDESLLYLNSGEVSKMKIETIGQSAVLASVTAEKAKLKAMGDSAIMVDEVIGECKKEIVGSSRIKIG